MLCRPFHGLDGPPTLTWGSAFSSTPGFMLPPAPRAKTCHMPLDKTSNNLVNDVLNVTLKVWVAPDWIIACMGRGRHAGLPLNRFAPRSKAGLSSLHRETTLTASTASTPKLASNLPRNRTKRYGVDAAEYLTTATCVPAPRSTRLNWLELITARLAFRKSTVVNTSADRPA